MKFVKLTRESDYVWIAVDKISAIYSPRGYRNAKINSMIVLIDDNTQSIDVYESGDEIMKLIQESGQVE